MRIEVTGDDVQKGVRGRPTRCPIARAMRRALGWRGGVYVHTGYAYLSKGGHSVVAPLPSSATRFIYEFDDQRPVGPFAFEFDFDPSEHWNVPSPKVPQALAELEPCPACGMLLDPTNGSPCEGCAEARVD